MFSFFLANFLGSLILQAFFVKVIHRSNQDLWTELGKPVPYKVFGRNGRVASSYVWKFDGRYTLLKTLIRTTHVVHYVMMLFLIWSISQQNS